MDNKQWLLLGCGLMAASGMQAQQAQRPNIIYIMCDDLGYADIGCYGQEYISTPNLDRMASEGMRFTQAYAGSPVSAPSRASFMTGQHTGHTKVRGNKEYWPYSGTVYYGNNADYKVFVNTIYSDRGNKPLHYAETQIQEILYAAEVEAGERINEADVNASEILKKAQEEAAKHRAQAQKDVFEIYAKAQAANVDLYKFLINLDTLVNSINSSTVLVVKADQYPFNILTEYSQQRDIESEGVMINDLAYILSALPEAKRTELVNAINDLIDKAKDGVAP